MITIEDLLEAYKRGLNDGKLIGYKIGIKEWEAYESDMEMMKHD